MAIILPGPLAAQVSGSIGGTTFSRNKGGAYVRNRSIPTDPNTTFQQIIRARMSTLTQAWTGTLTGLERIGWGIYATNVPWTNALGQVIHLSGINWYIQSNMLLLQAGLPRQDTAPTDYTRAEGDPSLSFTATEAASALSVIYDDTLPWVDEDDAGLLFYVSRPNNISINYFKGPYRFVDVVLGDLALPPASPEAMTGPFPYSAGNRIFGKAVIVRADGRTSAPHLLQTTAV